MKSLRINHNDLMKHAKKFFAEALKTLDERGKRHGNINVPGYHLKGIGVKADRAAAGRVDRDNFVDMAAYAFLYYYTSGRAK
jgi:hypothetical protein